MIRRADALHVAGSAWFVAIALTGCAIFPLPGPVSPVDGVASDAAGSTGVRGFGSGVFPVGAGGGGTQVNHQFTTNLAANAEAVALAVPHGGTYLAGRIGGRYTFDNQLVALTAGVGGQDQFRVNNSQYGAITPDVGVRVGTLIGNKFEPYGDVIVAAGFALWLHGPTDLWVLTGGGLNVHLTEKWRLGLDLSVPVVGVNTSYRETQTILAAFALTLNVGYVFGG